jgi:hypothetical protein
MFYDEEARQRGHGDMFRRLSAWKIPEDRLGDVHDAAKASFVEVKSLTEYQDGKASRLLTVIAFLSVVVGAVFTRFSSEYAWPGFARPRGSPEWWLPSATYLLFIAYVVTVTLAVLFVLIAIRPTFNLPAGWRTGGGDQPKSMLFYAGILAASAPNWAAKFERLCEDNALKAEYTKCYVGEAFLVAEKVADKLSLIRFGMGALLSAMVILLLFFALFGATVIFIEPTITQGVIVTLPSLPAAR